MSAVTAVVNVGKGILAIGSKLWNNPTTRELIVTGTGMALNKLAQPSKDPVADSKPFSRPNLAMYANQGLDMVRNGGQFSAEQLNNLAIIANSVRNDGVKSILTDVKNQEALAGLGRGVLNVLSPERERALLEQPQNIMRTSNASHLRM